MGMPRKMKRYSCPEFLLSGNASREISLGTSHLVPRLIQCHPQTIIMVLPEELFQQTLFDQLLHYGLLLGAVFQLIAIAAIVVLPPKPEEEGETAEASEGKKNHQEGGGDSGEDVAQVVKGSAVPSSGKKGKKARKRK